MTKPNSAGTGCSDASRARRARWLARGSGMAIALGLCFGAAEQARAQAMPTIAEPIDTGRAVQATPTLPGNAAFGAISAVEDGVVVVGPSAILNWTTLDTATLDTTSSHVNFLPQGTTLTFTGTEANFTVLNRIFPTANGAGQYRGIAIDGTVRSQLISGGLTGNIWFYSPGGILLGSNASFSVGGLVLTTSDVNAITSGRVDFLGAPQDFSSVHIAAGASINLTSENSYLAVVAPTIEQHGTVQVNGSTTYFVTDSGAILLDGNGGLAAQVTDVDSNPLTIEGAAANGNYLIHTGTTGGVASLQVQDVNGTILSADPHIIEFLAPNSAVTLEISGSVGYEAAAVAASGANGSVIIRGADGFSPGLPSDVESAANSLTVSGTGFTSSVAISGFNQASIIAGTGETISLGTDGWGALDLSVSANSVSIGAAAGGSLTVDGNLSIFDGRSDRAGSFALDVQSDPAGVLAPGSVMVGGNLSIDTSIRSGGSPIQPEAADDIAVTIGDGASLIVGGQAGLDTSTYSGRVQGVSPYQSSEIRSGAVTLSVGDGATLTVAGNLTIRTDASRSEGGYAYGASSTAGDVDIDFVGSQVLVGGLSIYSDAQASPGYYSNPADVTYDGTGGRVTIDIVGGAADLGPVLIDASGMGGTGGPTSPSGAGIGGDVSLTSTGMLSVTDLTIVADGVGAAGRDGSFLGFGGSGGEGRGGSIVVDTGSTITGLTSIDLSAIGTGGAGGAAYSGSGSYAGGAGGGGYGGSITLTARGSGTTLAGLSTLALDVTGTGGDGGDGAYGFSGGSTNGYAGGNGTGGSLVIESRTGAYLEIPSGADLLSANGYGGAGGSGGGNYGGPATTGGDGGGGLGGSLSLVAQGGTLAGGSIDLTSTGTGGAAGAGGYVYNPGIGSYYGPDGTNGAGSGGSVSLAALEGSPGVISLGAISIDASGFAGGGDITVPTTGGAITITDASTDPAGLITMTSLNAVSAGGSGTPGDFSVAGDSGPITVNGAVSVDVDGNILFDFAGTGQLVAAGATTLTAAGSIAVSHAGNAVPTLSLDSAGAFTATAGGDFIVGSGAIVNSGATVSVRAQGAIAVDDIRGVGSMDLSAGLGNTVRNASVSGAPTTVPLGALSLVATGLTITAGGDNGSPVELFDPNYNVLITGNVTSTGFIQVEAGGTATFQAGSSTISDNGLRVRTGDDIVIGAGALVAAAANPATAVNPAFLFSNPNNLFLQAGDISGAELVAPILTPIASIVSAATIDANSFAAVLTGHAIDGAGGVVSGASIAADINDAPAIGVVQRDDNGLLTDPCLEGDACLGTIGATNRVEIGQASNNDVIALYVEAGNVSADTILITTRQSIGFGTAGAPSMLSATTQFAANSILGDITLLDAAITSDLIRISAAGSLLGTASLVSASDIGITVGADISAALIDTGGQLTTVGGIGGAFETSYSLPGSITVGSLVQGAATGVNIISGGNISIGSIITPTQAILLTANAGTAYLGTTSAAGAASVEVLAQSIEFDDLAATGAITLVSSVGGISGGPLADRPFGPTTPFGGSGSLSAGGTISLSSAGDIRFDSGTASGGDFAALAGDTILFGSAAASGLLDFRSTRGISGSGVAQADTGAVFTTGPDGIDLAALAAPVAMLIADGGPVRVNAASVDQLTASGSDIFLRATGSLALFASASAGNIDVRAAGDLTVDLADATGAIALAADGGNLVTNPFSDGPTISGLSADLFAAQDITLDGDVFVQQSLAMNAGGVISVQAPVSGATITSRSADMDIGAAGRLGDASLTTDILIGSDGTGPMTLGGDGTASGFALGAAEVGRIRGNGNLVFDAPTPGGAGPALVIGDVTFAVTGGTNPGQIGTGGTLSLRTDGDALVTGALLVDGAGADTSLEILAGQALRIDTRTGNLRLADPNGGATGQLLLSATDLFAVTDEALADLDGLSLDRISDRLALNDGVDRPDGVIQTGALTISTTASRVFIQNTAPGTGFADRRGIVVGALTLTDRAGTVMPIVINGIVGQAQGIAAIAATDIQASFDPRSTINGCLIANPASCGRPSNEPQFPSDGIQDLIEEGIDGSGGTDGLKADTVLIDIAEQEEFRDDPLIDEPVTGAGNDDLWSDGGYCSDDGAGAVDCPTQGKAAEPAQ
ncbi:MAG: hypothetical protein WC692_07110 [Erythrobacter sp.]|jgi:filamentous hemagglutinin family protein